MQKKHLPVAFELLEYYAGAFRVLFQETLHETFPADQELTHSCFEKNDVCLSLRNLINETMGAELAFHPLKLYTYVFKYLRFKDRDEYERFQKHPDGAVYWKVTKTFPDMLFRLLGYRDLEEFMGGEAGNLDKEVIARQRKYIHQYYANQQKKGRQANGFYHCYVSDLKGFKIGKMAVFNDDTIELILNDRELSHYHGLVKKHANWLTMDLWKNTEPALKSSLRKAAANQAFEVSFKFLPEEDFKEHIFIFGTFSAINRNDHDIKNPARVAGPIILEWIHLENPENIALPELPFIQPEEVDPVIAAKVSSRRTEEVKNYTRKSNAENFAEQRREELSLINVNNRFIQNPGDCIGKYLCLVYSKSNDALRKLVFTVHNDLTVSGLATKYVNDHTVINYTGRVTSFANGLFSFRAEKGLRHDYLEGAFLCKSKKKPMYGLLTGIFKDIPKAGRAVLVPVTDALQAAVSTEIPEIISIKSQAYENLDRLYSITRFYAGKFLEEERLDSNLIVNDSIEGFRQLLCQQRGDFQELQGIYEEYYFDHNEQAIRKDYLIILPTGKTFMVGTHRYRGIIKNLGARFLADFRSLRLKQNPVFYLMHLESNPWKLFSGVFGTVTEDGREITGNAVYLHKTGEEVLKENEFFQAYSSRTERILPNTERFRELNRQLGNLGHRLSGEIGNYIITGSFQEADALTSNSRQVAYTFFFSACFLASQGDVKNTLKAVEELKRAFKHGFTGRIMLEREMKEGKALSGLRDIIDADNFRILEDGWKKGAV